MSSVELGPMGHELRPFALLGEAVAAKIKDLQLDTHQDQQLSGLFQKYTCLFLFMVECLKVYLNCFMNPQKELEEAIADKDFTRAEALLKMKPVNISTGQYETRAPWSVMDRDGYSVNPLIRTTLLHEAASHGDVETVRFLLKHGAEVGMMDQFGQTPLHWAMFASDEVCRHKMADLLLSEGAEVDGLEGGGQTPLMIAAGLGDVMMVAKLSLQGANVDAVTNGGNSALRNAAGCFAKAMHAGRVSEAEKFREVVHFLLDQGATPDFGQYLPQFSDDLLERIKAGKLDPNATGLDGASLLEMAYGQKDMKFLHALIETQGINLDVPFVGGRGKTLLHLMATKDENAGMVKKLLEKGAEPRVQDSLGRTPLHTAATTLAMECAKALLTNDATLVEVVARAGETPLHSAAVQKEGSLMVGLLISQGAVVDAVNEQGLTPLMVAAFSGSVAVVEKLCQSGASVNAIGQLGNTPLHFATERDASDLERDAVIQVLLKHRAQPVANGAGEIPDVARFLRAEKAADAVASGVGMVGGFMASLGDHLIGALTGANLAGPAPGDLRH